MKKIILSLSVLACFAISSCSSDDNKEEIVIDNSVSQKFIGKWNLKTGIIIEDGQTYTIDLKTEGCNYDFFDLRSNGTKDEVYHSEDGNCTEENFVGTWVYDQTDNTITTIDTDDNYEMVYEVIEISTNSMKVKLISDDGEAIPNSIEIYSILEK